MADAYEKHRAELSKQYTTALFAGLIDVADVLKAELDRLEHRAESERS